MTAPVSAAQESSINSMVNVDESSKAIDEEKARRQTETDKILALQDKEESEKESEKEEKKKPKTLYFRKEYGDMES